MATVFTLTTTDAEDAAILALTTQAAVGATGAGAGVPETVTAFLTRQLRHQIDFAVQTKATADNALRDAEYQAATPTDQATIDATLGKVKIPKV